jgi:hypothetical protein
MEAVGYTETLVPITENRDIETHCLENPKSHAMAGCCEHGASRSKGWKVTLLVNGAIVNMQANHAGNI